MTCIWRIGVIALGLAGATGASTNAPAADARLEAAIRAAVEVDDGRPNRYAYHRIDLDGDGKDEALVYLLGPDFCGTGGCTMLLLAPKADGYRLVQQFSITQTPVLAASERSHGWRDLIRHEAGGGARASFVRHRFDGHRYVPGQRSVGTAAPRGDVVFPADLDFEQGLPLAPATGLGGTRWQLVEFQSMDDAQGTTRPADPSRYTISFSTDGSVSAQLDCNRALGSWNGSDTGSGGELAIGPLATTKMLCPPPSMGESLEKRLGYVRSYRIVDGRLAMALMADGGIIVWERSDPPK
jgi:hypothetical protein